MPFFIVPTENAPALKFFDLVVDLDGSDYQLIFRYNERENFWYIDVLDAAGNPIRNGLKCVINWPLLRRCVLESRPPGSLMVLDARTEPAETGLDNFGSLAELIYADASEIPE